MGSRGEGDKSSKSLDFVQNHPPPQLLAHEIGHWVLGIGDWGLGRWGVLATPKGAGYNVPPGH
ncbi:hypothetical protein JYQ62_08360 [Nostoc sp. UHCC 0702]|nr:hypothetical protein JYQ62_08360 [Nostoc sp. UHCC 0702]